MLTMSLIYLKFKTLKKVIANLYSECQKRKRKENWVQREKIMRVNRCNSTVQYSAVFTITSISLTRGLSLETH